MLDGSPPYAYRPNCRNSADVARPASGVSITVILPNAFGGAMKKNFPKTCSLRRAICLLSRDKSRRVRYKNVAIRKEPHRLGGACMQSKSWEDASPSSPRPQQRGFFNDRTPVEATSGKVRVEGRSRTREQRGRSAAEEPASPFSLSAVACALRSRECRALKWIDRPASFHAGRENSTRTSSMSASASPAAELSIMLQLFLIARRLLRNTGTHFFARCAASRSAVGVRRWPTPE